MPEPTTRDEELAAREFYTDDTVTLYLGDALDVLRLMPDASVDCIVTSPPYYGLRDYGTAGQYGLEETPQAYVATMTAVFREARRVLAGDGTCWINLGDSYVCSPKGSASATDGLAGRSNHVTTPPGSGGKSGGGLPAKSLLMVPARVALALQDDGWLLRNEVVWHKTNAMPESVTDRLSSKHEKLFLLTPGPRYVFDLDAIREPATKYASTSWQDRKDGGEPGRYGTGGMRSVGASMVAAHPNGRNPGDVWSIATRPYRNAHFATFPIDLPLRCIKAGCKPDGTVLDLFSGAGTTGVAARMLMRRYVGIDVNRAYHGLAIERFAQGILL